MIRTDHPKILWTPERLAEKRAQWAAKTPEAVAFAAKATEALSLNPDNPYGYSELCWNLSCAYLITQDPRFADRAIQRAMLEVAKGPAGWKRDSGFDSRGVLPALSITYDWCYDRLTPTQKAAFEAHLRGWVNWIWDLAPPVPGAAEFSVQEAWCQGMLMEEDRLKIEALRELIEWRALPGAIPEGVIYDIPLPQGGYGNKAPHGNYYWGHVWGTMAAALALGDEALLAIAIQKRNAISGYLNGLARGGWLHDGTSYGCGMIANLMLAMASFKTATGEDIFSDSDADLMRCLIAATLPDMKGVVPFGDQSDNNKNLWSGADLKGPHIYQAFATEDVPLVRFWLASVLPHAPHYGWERWWEYLFASVSPLAAPVRPSFYVAPGPGFAMSQAGDTKLFFRCGENLSDHTDQAASGYCLYRGSDPIIGMARLKAHAGTERESQYCNVLTVDGYGQWGPGASKLEAYEDTPVLTYLRGEASSPYAIPSSSQHLPLLEWWQREILALKRGGEIYAVVILDRVRKVKPESVVTLHTQLQAAPLDAFQNYMVKVGSSAMRCDSLLPVDDERSTTPLLLGPRPGTGSTTSWRRNDIGPAGKENVFLNVYQHGDLGFSPLPVFLNVGRLTIGAIEVTLLPTLSLVQAPPVPVLTLKDAADELEAAAMSYYSLADRLEETANDATARGLEMDAVAKRFREASDG